MKKYDCNKLFDCRSELQRMCDSYITCSAGCPLRGHSCTIENMNQKGIDILQKWSDEHPEAPTLTKKDRAFLMCFMGVAGRKIVKDSSGISFYDYDATYSRLSDDMFKALEPNTTMTFGELLALEVED